MFTHSLTSSFHTHTRTSTHVHLFDYYLNFLTIWIQKVNLFVKLSLNVFNMRTLNLLSLNSFFLCVSLSISLYIRFPFFTTMIKKLKRNFFFHLKFLMQKKYVYFLFLLLSRKYIYISNLNCMHNTQNLYIHIAYIIYICV